MLTQILQIRRLANEPRDLIDDILLLARPSISACELLFNARENLQGARVLHFLGLDVVGGRRDAGAVAAGLHGADGVDGGGVRVAHDGLAALGGEGGLDGGGGVV